jgi:cold shock CspA family protein
MTDLDHGGHVVSWKGRFGFIHRDGDHTDTFIHSRDLLNGLTDLLPGRRVKFVTVIDEKSKRPKAIRCRYEQ